MQLYAFVFHKDIADKARFGTRNSGYSYSLRVITGQNSKTRSHDGTEYIMAVFILTQENANKTLTIFL